MTDSGFGALNRMWRTPETLLHQRT